MTADPAASCDAIAAWLPVARALLAEPDADGTTGGGKPGSHPPWNGAAANAFLDAHAGVRLIELTMRIEAGLPARRRGGSDANTIAAIAAIETLSSGDVSDAAIATAVRDLDRLTRPILELPAVDKEEPSRRIRGTCPYCGFGMLAVWGRSGEVACLRSPPFGDCRDRDGHRPVGHMDVSRLTADPLIRWNDGLVT